VHPGSGDRRPGNERRGGSDRRSGQDRRKLSDPQYIGVERSGSERTDEEPKCQRCAACLEKLRVLILECPFPDKNCIYNQYHEIIHYVTYPSARLENESAVVASSSSDISSYSIILIRPDPILEKNRIYYIQPQTSNFPLPSVPLEERTLYSWFRLTSPYALTSLTHKWQLITYSWN
jgi:hypothetical protein